MTTPPADPITARDRIVTTLCFALLLHGLVIFGIAFTAERPDDRRGTPTLEVVSVNAPADEPPEQADYLADTAQRGAGNIDDPERPRSPAASVGEPDSTARHLPDPGYADAVTREMLTDDNRPLMEAYDMNLLATHAASHVSVALDLSPGAGGGRPMPHGVEMLLPSIPADTDAHTVVAHSRNPRERFISVNTQEVVYAAYMNAWRERVERVGNLNYPDEARRRGMTGVVTLEVVIDSSGKVRHLLVRESSGHRLLDDAALRTVYMATPFDEFPEELRKEADSLRFVYEWVFGDRRARTTVRGIR